MAINQSFNSQKVRKISVFSGGVPPLHVNFGLPVPSLSLGSFAWGNLPVLVPLPRIHLSLSDVWFTSSGSIRLLIKSSTMDPFRSGVLFIGPLGNSLCPVSALRHYLPLRGYVPGPLFVSSNGCSLFPFLANSWLRYFSHSLNYFSYSFRIGAAISAADCKSSSSPYHNSWSPVP